jgi:hypothetical protein
MLAPVAQQLDLQKLEMDDNLRKMNHQITAGHMDSQASFAALNQKMDRVFDALSSVASRVQAIEEKQQPDRFASSKYFSGAQQPMEEQPTKGTVAAKVQIFEPTSRQLPAKQKALDTHQPPNQSLGSIDPMRQTWMDDEYEDRQSKDPYKGKASTTNRLPANFLGRQPTTDRPGRGRYREDNEDDDVNDADFDRQREVAPADRSAFLGISSILNDMGGKTNKASRERQPDLSVFEEQLENEFDPKAEFRQSLGGYHSNNRQPDNGVLGGQRNTTHPLDNQLPQVQLMGKQPPYSHIYLSELSLIAVLDFVRKFVRYYTQYGITFNLPTRCEDSVIAQLVSRHYDQCGAFGDLAIYKMRADLFIRLLLKCVQPDNPLLFLQTLKKVVRVKLPDGYFPDILNFDIFRNALYKASQSFKTAYECMAEHNESNTPPCTNKEGGLVKLWTDIVPFGFATDMLKKMNSKTDFQNVHIFFKKFISLVRELDDTSRSAKNANLIFSLLKEKHPTDFSRHDRSHHHHHSERQHERSHHYKVHKDSRNKFHHGDGKPSFHQRHHTKILPRPDRPQHVHHMQNIPGEDDFVEDDSMLNEDARDFVSDNSHHTSDEESQYSSDIDSDEDHARPNNNIHSDRLAVINNATSKKAPCTNFMAKMSCVKGDKCTYSHDPALCLDALPRYIAKFEQSPLLVDSKGRLQKPSTRAITTDNLGHISEVIINDRPLEDADDLPDDLLHSLTRSTTAPVLDAVLIAATQLSGRLLLDNKKTLSIPDVLLDTGARKTNYISKQFVDQHRRVLRPHLIPASGIIKFANGTASTTFDEILVSTLAFTAPNSRKVYNATVHFCVFETTSCDAIVGLKTMLKHFYPLHRQLMDLAHAALLGQDEDNSSPLMHHVIDSSPDLIEPWSYKLDVLAPEDEATPLPSSFSQALYFMETPHEAALADLVNEIPNHVSKEFAEATNVVNLIMTKGIQVFIPREWKGVSGIPPLELEWKETLPDKLKPKARHINPRLFDHAKKEFERLMKYMYVPSNSSIASCLVIAPKATAPFIRFCGDYVEINRFIVIGQYPIPNVRHELQKLIKFKIFIDLDMANAFHQILLGPITSGRLAIQTPWGLVQPRFVPEGIGPASGILQRVVSEIFADFADWIVVIFDNFLILAHDFQDAYVKLEKIFDRCISRNVILKFSKSWFGYTEAKFFGYICRHGSYELSDERKQALLAIAFPNSLKMMQSFLGAALFFKEFVPHFSSLSAPLHDMTKKTFNWSDKSTWTRDYEADFNSLKEALVQATAIFYPDYDLVWILRTDASTNGIGAVLLQVAPGPSPAAPSQLQPICFVSKKFSDQAQRWTTIEQECFAIYYAVDHLSFYLRNKPFILETDHNNLIWLEKSTVSKLMRWRIFLQGFNFQLRHIPGKQNIVADFLSRAPVVEKPSSDPPPPPLLQLLHTLALESPSGDTDDLDSQQTIELDASAQSPHPKTVPHAKPSKGLTLEQMFAMVHGGRMGHPGAGRTWSRMNETFPGHGFSFRVIREEVANCIVCQKTRIPLVDFLQPIVRCLKPSHRRAVVGADTLKITPGDAEGNEYFVVVVNHFTKYCAIYPVKTHDAKSTALALFKYICSFGLFDSLITDPGTEFANEVVASLTQYLGITHKFSLVDRHESNGVERTNRTILDFLSALFADSRLDLRDPTVLPLVQYHLNSQLNSESGCIPFHAHFGTADATYLQLPPIPEDALSPKGKKKYRRHDAHAAHLPEFINLLNTNLKLIQQASLQYQMAIKEERTKNNPPFPNHYQKGDLVLLERDPAKPKPTKLSPKFLGPYEVIVQKSNDVECRDIIHGNVKAFHVGRLKLFKGTLEEAKKMAMIDNNQHEIEKIIAYAGDPLKRTTMSFHTEFKDGSSSWLPFSKDLFDTVQYENFCRSRPELFPILYTLAVSEKELQNIREQEIKTVKPGDIVFVDLRSFGHLWHDNLPIEDPLHTVYLLEHEYLRYGGTKKSPTKKKIIIHCKVFESAYVVDGVFVKLYGERGLADWKKTDLKIVIIDKQFYKENPALKGNK